MPDKSCLPPAFSLSRGLLLVVGLIACLSASAPRALADDGNAPAATQPAQAPATQADIARAAEQLGAERFADRQAASELLEAAGKDAIGALEKAALGESLEANARAVAVLQKLGKSANDATRQAALAALKRLAESDRPVANRAQEALRALQPDQATPALVAPGGFRGNLRILGGNVQIQGVPVGAGFSKISISNVNGVKRIEAQDNGRKVTIDEDPKNGIKMEVVTRKDGKDVTEKYQAKNADELKEKFPEAHKLYKQYSDGIAARVGAVQVGAGAAVQIGPGAVRVGPATAPAVAPPARGARSLPISLTTTLMKRLTEQLEAIQQAGRLKDATPEEREDLKKQIEQLKRQISELEKQLDRADTADAPDAEKK